jgi:hypothetical protein
LSLQGRARRHDYLRDDNGFDEQFAQLDEMLAAA